MEGGKRKKRSRQISVEIDEVQPWWKENLYFIIALLVVLMGIIAYSYTQLF